MFNEMFVGDVDLGNGTGLELVILPLKGTELKGMWGKETDLFLLCLMQNSTCCTFRPSDHFSRYVEKLRIPEGDAKCLAKWLSEESWIQKNE